MAGGVVITSVCAVLLAVFAPARTPLPGARELLPILSAVNALVAVVIYPLSSMLFRGVPGTTGADAEARLRSAVIARAALREGSGLLGATVCIIGALRGALAARPLFWLNMLTPLVFVAVTLLNLPTEASLQDLLASQEMSS